MHKEWQDLIPFYVAQTLSVAEKQTFEHHLNLCHDCQRAVNEWRIIATKVWLEADQTAKQLKPLTPNFYHRLKARPLNTHQDPPYPAYAQTTRHQSIPSRRTYTSTVTLVAGFLVTFLFGGLIILMNTPANDEQNISANQPQIALDFTQTPTATPTRDDFGIINITALPSAVHPTNTPSITPSTPATLPQGSDDVGISAVMPPYPPVSTLNPNQCYGFNGSTSDINIFQQADHLSQIIGSMPSQMLYRIQLISENGWYQLLNEENATPGIGGWVEATHITLVGTCETLSVSTPALEMTSHKEITFKLAETPQIVIITASYVDIYDAINGNIVGRKAQNTVFDLIGTGTIQGQTWYQVAEIASPPQWVQQTGTRLEFVINVSPTNTPTAHK